MRDRRRLLSLVLAVSAAAAPPLAGPGVAAGPWAQPLPLAVETVFRNGSAAGWTRGPYSSSNASAASGTLVSPGGSAFLFEDAFANTSDAGFTLTRRVTVVAVGAGDEVGFSTRFSMPAPDALAEASREIFLPGVVYENASALPSGALAGNTLAAHILVREDRLPLPLALAFFPGGTGGAGGEVARLVHRQPDGRTIADEDFTARIIDARLQFGSIGFLNDLDAGADEGVLPRLSVAFQYPGSEGDRTYVWRPTDGWANRSHPIAGGVPHEYTLRFEVSQAASYYEAVRSAWRAEADVFAPRVAVAPTPAQLYRDGVELLASVAVEYNGVPSVPFEASLPGGAVIDTSSQMGFVGRALPCAALLLFDAVVAAPNATRQLQAEAVVDLWAQNAITSCGVARTWYNIANESIVWRASDAYQGSIRIMCDGMLGLVDAWTVVQRPAWLAAAVRFGDFLVSAQAADGSIVNAFDWACAPLATDVRQTAFVVPFLVALFNATSDKRYKLAATRAGTFAALFFNGSFGGYFGGAVDNSDAIDKEAGWLHMQAFVALFELTSDASWLAPAARAATFFETFVYLWSVPIECVQSPPTVFPCRRTSLGFSLIATGQSGADNFAAIASFAFKRLGLWIADDHFISFGAFLANATAQVTDWDGSLGYASRGLMNEAATLSVRRGTGVADWLPWLTANVLQPIVQAARAGEREAV